MANPHFLAIVEAFSEVSFSLILNLKGLDTPLVGQILPCVNKAISGIARLGEAPNTGPRCVSRYVVYVPQVIPAMSTCDDMRLPVEQDGV